MSSLVSNSNKAFERLAQPVQRWIRDQGWSNLRPVQATAINIVLEEDKDVVIAAATAGGKTEAAFLPLVSNVLDSPSELGGFDIVYVAPLKALISDQAIRLESMLEKTELFVNPWHGDINQSRKKQALKKPSGVLLITPESLEAMFVLRGREIPILFAATRAVIIDELHTFLDSDRGVHLRSLLCRLDLSVNRRIRRVGLSATLGEMELVKNYLNPDEPDNVWLIKDSSTSQELRIQVRGYVEPGEEDENGIPNVKAISSHIYEKHRGSRNLIFAGSREKVETYADRLASICEKERVPIEFLPHHGSLSREHRFQVEDTLREGRLPMTAICTSTLELGIDIGDVVAVGQIGPPFSVAALRQRLGRSGRRDGEPAILRVYIDMLRLSTKSNSIDRLRLELIQAIAMIELLLEGWCEPPQPGALNLSTLTHQILSIIAEKEGASARRLYKTLCQKGPFRAVSVELFESLLKDIGQPKIALIEQSPNGLLLLGEAGERIVSDYGFYAVFKSQEEYRLVANAREIGAMPIDSMLLPGMTIIFAGCRWLITDIDTEGKVIQLEPSRSGKPPKFEGEMGAIHHKIRKRMRSVIEDKSIPRYLDPIASNELKLAREEYARLKLKESSMVAVDDERTLLNLWAGTKRTSTLTLALRNHGLQVYTEDAIVEIPCNIDELRKEHLPSLTKRTLEIRHDTKATLSFDKYHGYLSTPLLLKDAFSSRLDPSSLEKTVDYLTRR